MAFAQGLQDSTEGAHTSLSPSGHQLIHHAGVKCDALADEQLCIAHSCGRPVHDPDNALTCQQVPITPILPTPLLSRLSRILKMAIP